MSKKVTMVDPPSGWKYGFPKAMPPSVKEEEFNAWLVREGYPQKLIDLLGEHFYCRFWEYQEDAE